jgi:hypothetical protein
MGFSYGESTNWAISCSYSGGVVTFVGASRYDITLLDVDNQIFFPGIIGGSSAGAGLKAGGAVSTFSPTFFTVSPAMYASDFDNSLCLIMDIGLTIGVGGSLTGLTIYGVNHSPGLLDLGGVNAGLGAGATFSPLMYLYVNSSKAWKNPGCIITPGGDPMCGGYSKAENQTKDPRMSGGR